LESLSLVAHRLQSVDSSEDGGSASGASILRVHSSSALKPIACGQPKLNLRKGLVTREKILKGYSKDLQMTAILCSVVLRDRRIGRRFRTSAT